MSGWSVPAIEAIRAGSKPAVAQALAAVEAAADDAAVIALLDAAWAAPKGHVIGITGPPGVGKSSLLAVLIDRYRQTGRSVGIIAVDPSSKKTRGALLGDRTRIKTDPSDTGIFIRSMAARDRLGGLAGLSFPAMVLFRAAFDVVLIETVGVGQSETDIRDLADTVVFCIQPGSGDSLQFMKAGVMEVPDLVIVTKADMGAPARRARADVEGALSLAVDGAPEAKVLLVSASQNEGLDALVAALDHHLDTLSRRGLLHEGRKRQTQLCLDTILRERFGYEGLAILTRDSEPDYTSDPFTEQARLARDLLSRLDT
ncbi:MAG: GTP-binding protein [Pseudomonadota bacterium]